MLSKSFADFAVREISLPDSPGNGWGHDNLVAVDFNFFFDEINTSNNNIPGQSTIGHE